MIEAAPPTQNLSHVFSEDYVEANESSHRKSYSTAWRHSKSIQKSILSYGKYNEDSSRSLTISLIHNYLKDIVSQAGSITPTEYSTAIQQTKMITVAKSNGNCRKQTEHSKTFVTTNLVSIVSSPRKKSKKHELDDIQSILGCSCITVKRKKHWISANRLHLLSVPTYKTIKWAIKPQFFCKKKVDNSLISKVIDWVLHNSNVREYPIVRDNLLI